MSAAEADPKAAHLLAQGRLAFARGRPSESRRLLLRALRIVERGEDPDSARVRAQVHISLALPEFELRGRAAAMTCLARAAELIGRHSLAPLEAALRNQRGILALRVGDLHAALREFDAGVAVPGAAAVRDRCHILVNRAIVHMDLRELPAARADLERCVRLTAAAGLQVIQAQATHNLGYVEFLAGDLPRALRLMDAAIALDETVSPGVALLGKAYVLVEAGLLHDAETALHGAATTFAAQRLTLDLAEAEVERARCELARGEHANARRLAGAARTRYRRRGNERLRRAAELVLLQADLDGGRPGRRLIGPARRLQRELAADGLRLPARTATLLVAEAQLAAGDVRAASATLAAAGPSRHTDPITSRMQSHHVHARTDAAGGRSAAAARRARRGLGELADYQARFGSIDLRTAAAVHGRRLADLDITLAVRSARPSAVFAAAERGRSVVSRLPAVSPPTDAGTVELLAELRQVIEGLRSAGQDRAAAEVLLRRRRQLERRIVSRSWHLDGTGPALRVAELEHVRAELDDQTLVTFVQCGAGLWALVVDERVRLVELGPREPVVECVKRCRADLDVLAAPRLPGGLAGAVRASLHQSLQFLQDTLIAPLDLDGRPLVLVSTGTLGQLPWASLPALRGVPVVVAPSATKWLSSRHAPGRPPAPPVAMAGPDLGRGVDEVRDVGAAWPDSRVVHGAAATGAAFADAMASARLLHVAAHGVHQVENPLFSFVRLADGPVFAHELDRAAHAPEHVVLSACEVGLATIRPGDEALGLASVLLQLGSRSVVAGVARVSDELAARTMACYHAELAAGADSAHGLARALVEVDAETVPPFVTFGASWTAAVRA